MGDTFFQQLRSLLIGVSVFVILPVYFLPLYFYRRFVIFLARLTKPDLGNVFPARANAMAEERCIRKEGNVPKCSVVSTMELADYIALSELQSLFKTNVLEEPPSSPTRAIRYPELKQFPVSFMGYAFWKNDPNFDIQNHIVEEFYSNEQPNLSSLHENMMNKSYSPGRSPWELILINDYKISQNWNERKTLVVARFHHSMGDPKSVLKLFVECLGEQSLTTAEPQPAAQPDSLPMLPIKLAVSAVNILAHIYAFWSHSLKIKRSERKSTDLAPQSVKLSPKLPLNDIKEVARKSGGTTSSVVAAVVSGAIQKVRPDVGALASAYVVPKDNHPEILCNHTRVGALSLPTDEKNTARRLHRCHEAFKDLKISNSDKYLEPYKYLISSLFSPIREMYVREALSIYPITLVNIPGERNGFSVGKRECFEFVFSVGTMRGDTGITFCVSSYKDHLRVAVISASGILDEVETEKLANSMGKELKILKSLYS